VVFAGAVPAALFGADVCGMPPTTARALARQCATAAAIGGLGADPALAWAVQGAWHLSPADLATASPLLRYARGWWEALHPEAMVRRRALSVTELLAAFTQAAHLAATAKRWAALAHDPMLVRRLRRRRDDAAAQHRARLGRAASR
jgi:hypothetical protein